MITMDEDNTYTISGAGGHLTVCLERRGPWMAVAVYQQSVRANDGLVNCIFSVAPTRCLPMMSLLSDDAMAKLGNAIRSKPFRRPVSE